MFVLLVHVMSFPGGFRGETLFSLNSMSLITSVSIDIPDIIIYLHYLLAYDPDLVTVLSIDK